MSANKWRRCPKCLEIRENMIGVNHKKLKESYEKVTVEEFMRMQSAFEEFEEENFEARTLREDYEVGTDEGGLFYVEYTGSCDECGFSHSFKYESDALDDFNKKK